MIVGGGKAGRSRSPVATRVSLRISQQSVQTHALEGGIVYLRFTPVMAVKATRPCSSEEPVRDPSDQRLSSLQH